MIILLVVSSNLFFVSSKTAVPEHVSYADPKICATCHKAITDSFLQTAHYFDSRPADSNSIKGSFEEGDNRYKYNQFMEVVMYKEEDRYMQATLVNGMLTTSAPFDVVIGSGRNGQTYLTWVDNQLFQLPISYYAPARQWCNSPGFPNYAYFGRQVPANCLECHTTQTKVISHETMDYDKSSVVYGITCARCHPGAEQHAAFHTSNPQEKKSKFVINAAHLDRQLRMDACALCHSGFRNATQPAFSFTVGDTLENFSKGSPVSQKADTLDVHGNQYGLLTASQCYIKSTTMDCSTCHNVHNTEYRNPKLFSTRCMSCHERVDHKTCSFETPRKIVKSNNCIDCHMPVLASKNILLNVKSGEPLQTDNLRSHYISVYKEATKQFMKKQPK
ncbi:MAG: hypothetical protein JNK79_12615 [Chitinophagaceae bacterium]|nr:hypothetical protein [Chitinophagaceae bacterium]